MTNAVAVTHLCRRADEQVLLFAGGNQGHPTNGVDVPLLLQRLLAALCQFADAIILGLRQQFQDPLDGLWEDAALVPHEVQNGSEVRSISVDYDPACKGGVF